MPFNREDYPDNWEEMSKTAREWTDEKCDRCGVQNGATLIGKKSGKPYTVRLALAHLNHDVTDNRPENLSPLCQPCHLKHDRWQHGTNARKTHFRKIVENMLDAGQIPFETDNEEEQP